MYEFWCVRDIATQTVLWQYARRTQGDCGNAVLMIAYEQDQYTGSLEKRLYELGWEIIKFQAIPLTSTDPPIPIGD